MRVDESFMRNKGKENESNERFKLRTVLSNASGDYKNVSMRWQTIVNKSAKDELGLHMS